LIYAGAGRITKVIRTSISIIAVNQIIETQTTNAGISSTRVQIIA
jgi:hypothetical protein